MNLEIDHIKYEAPIGKSDHVVLVFDFALEGSVEIDEFNFPKTRYFKGKYQAINEALSEIKWQQIKEPDILDKWDFLLNRYIELLEKFISTRNITENSSKNLTVNIDI